MMLLNLPNSFNRKLALSFAALVFALVGSYMLLKPAATQAYTPLATNVFPNPSASSPYPLYMTVGVGEFDVPIAAAAIIVDAPGTYNLYIEDAHFCNQTSQYSSGTALDLPLASQFLSPYFSTLFRVINPNTGADRMTPFETKHNRVCTNATDSNPYDNTFPGRHISVNFNVDPSDYDAETGKYKVVFAGIRWIPNPGYLSPPAAAENSFRITVSGANNPKIYFIGRDTGYGSSFFNLSNRDRPNGSEIEYTVDIALPCSATVGLAATLNFVDADYGLYQSFNDLNGNGVRNIGEPLLPDLTYQVYTTPQDGSGSPFTSILGPTVITGRNGEDFPIFSNYTLQPKTVYRIVFRGLAKVNAITYDLLTAGISEYFASDVCVTNTPPSGSISADCTAAGVLTISASATDIDGDPLTYSMSSNGPGVTNPMTGPGPFTFYPPRDGTTYTVTGTVSDNKAPPQTLTADTYNCPRPPAVPECTMAITILNSGFTFVQPGGQIRIDFTIRNAQTVATGLSFDGSTWPLRIDPDNIAGAGSAFTFTTYGTLAPGQSYSSLPNGTSRTYTVNVPANTYEIAAYLSNGGTYIPCNDNVPTTTGPTDCLPGNPDCCPPGSPFCTSTSVTRVPYIRAYGGDVIAGSGLETAGVCGTNTAADIRTYIDYNPLASGIIGSGTQMAAYALGAISGFRTNTQNANNRPQAKAFANVPPALNASINYGLLTTSTTQNFGGNYAGPLCLSEFSPPNSGTTALAPAFDMTNQQGVFTRTGDLNLTAAGSITGRKTIYVAGNVYITGGPNVTYNTAWGSLADVPSVVVVATGNIFISPTVTNLDGFYIARGTIYTCYNPANPAVLNITNAATNAPCIDSRLTVNGSLTATNIRFWRLAGTVANSTTTEHYGDSVSRGGETVRLSPEFLISEQAESSLNGSDGVLDRTYDAITSLPPTF